MSSSATRVKGQRRRQDGVVLVLALLMVVVLATGAVLTAQQRAAIAAAERSAREQQALAVARQSLVAYGLAFGANNHPGALPCPDMDGDAASNNTDCQGDDVYLGRLPAATLDADRTSLADAGTIWYAVAEPFVDFNPPGGRVNTASPATLSVGVRDQRYAAVLIAPGDPVAGQSHARPGRVAPGDYLEGANVDGRALHFAGCDRADCNDRVVGVTKAQLLEPVRRRLRGELADALMALARAKGSYPYAAPLGERTGACDPGRARGTLAVDPGGCASGAYLEQARDGGRLPDWIEDNGWHRYVYYAAAAPCLPGAVGCSAGAPNLLQLARAGERAAVVAMVGPPIVSAAKAGPQDRSAPPPRAVIEYLDSPENVDDDARFNDPPNGPGENDGIVGVAPLP